METIKLEELAPYLPYNLMFTFGTTGNCVILEMQGLAQGEINNSYHWWKIETNDIKPLLRPLSDMMLPEHILGIGKIEWNTESDNAAYTLKQYQYLYSHHFDLNKLIDRGLALSLHFIKQEGR